MRYIATNRNCYEEIEMTEEQVRAEIIDTLQNDMALWIESGKPVAEFEKEIVQHVNESKIEDYFEGNEFIGRTYDIACI